MRALAGQVNITEIITIAEINYSEVGVRFRVHFSFLKANIWRCITQTMIAELQQSEEAAYELSLP